jgi:superfamily II DNA or RNA helicase
METWIYPTNYEVRKYQRVICEYALLRNTLVCLPTGLGKTFIAAVVMYNYYRWFPDGKVVFMAPTKPLVNQQVEACHNIVGTTMMPSTFVCVIERMKIDNVIVAAFVAAFVAVVARYSGKRDCTSEWDREFKDERTVLERKESVLLHAPNVAK